LLSLPKFSSRDAALVSAVARWLGARELPVRVVRVGDVAIDPYAASCEVKIDGESIDVRGSARELAQELLGGPVELTAPRPISAIEHALWALAVARAAKAAGVACEVWPRTEAGAPAGIGIEVIVAGKTVVAYVPPSLPWRVPADRVPRWAETWTIDAPVVLGRCALPAGTELHVRDLVTIERHCELEIFGGVVALSAVPGAVVGEVVSGYVRRDMALADDAQVELSVALGTTRLTLRDVLGLAVGQIVQLGRPLAGPFEVRAQGRLVGRGELVDVDGELAVRIVSLEQE
jgi:flagellar motor switch/type III secretory pathway protein FliN